jgi:hypothetical protein
MAEISTSASEYEIKLIVDPPPPLKSVPSRDFYTYNDIVKGKINLQVFKDVTVKGIQVKLQGHATTQITKTVETLPGQYRQETDKMTHELLYDVSTLFPPHNVANVSSNKKFTLTKGRYEYEFALQVPFLSHCGDEDTRRSSNLYTSRYESGVRNKYDNVGYQHIPAPLPPNFHSKFHGQDGCVDYNLKVSVHRSGLFSSTTRLIHPISVRPPGPLSSRYSQLPFMESLSNIRTLKARLQGEALPSKSAKIRGLFSSSGKPSIKLRLQLWSKETLIPTERQSFKLMLQTSVDPEMKPPPVIYIRSVEMALKQRVDLNAKRFVDYYETEHDIYKSSTTHEVQLMLLSPCKEETGVFRSQLDVSDIIGDVDLEKVTPNFTTCNMAISYQLKTVVKISTSAEGFFFSGETLRLVHDVSISGPLVEEDELNTMIGESEIFQVQQPLSPPPPIDEQLPAYKE